MTALPAPAIISPKRNNGLRPAIIGDFFKKLNKSPRIAHRRAPFFIGRTSADVTSAIVAIALCRRQLHVSGAVAVAHNRPVSPRKIARLTRA